MSVRSMFRLRYKPEPLLPSEVWRGFQRYDALLRARDRQLHQAETLAVRFAARPGEILAPPGAVLTGRCRSRMRR